MNFDGIIISAAVFLAIGIFHPIVIKTEYYYGTRPWWIFLLLGVCCLVVALFVGNTVMSSILGAIGASFLWSIKELFDQRERVKKGWFKMNPKRKAEYED